VDNKDFKSITLFREGFSVGLARRSLARSSLALGSHLCGSFPLWAALPWEVCGQDILRYTTEFISWGLNLVLKDTRHRRKLFTALPVGTVCSRRLHSVSHTLCVGCDSTPQHLSSLLLKLWTWVFYIVLTVGKIVNCCINLSIVLMKYNGDNSKCVTEVKKCSSYLFWSHRAGDLDDCGVWFLVFCKLRSLQHFTVVLSLPLFVMVLSFA